MTCSKILAVDDDVRILNAIGRSLGKKGYEVLSAKTFAEAKDVLGKEEVDLCIFDLALPDGNGIDLLDYVRKEVKISSMPVIILSAFGESKLKELISACPDQILCKPFNTKDLLYAIENCTGN